MVLANNYKSILPFIIKNKNLISFYIFLGGCTEIKLEPAARQSFQYVRWDILKQKFHNSDVNIYFHIRPGKGTNLLFLTPKGQKSYIASAINVR